MDNRVTPLGGADLHPLAAPELLARARELVAAQNRLAAELARAVRRVELAGPRSTTG